MVSIGDFDPAVLIRKAPEASGPSLGFMGVIALCISYVVGFYATAGAAGVDFGSNSKDEKDVQMGGLMGVALAIIVTGGLSILIAAGAFAKTGTYEMNTAGGSLMAAVVSAGAAKWMGVLLAISAFPSACFSSFIAANSFKTTLPKVNPFISVGIGAIVAASNCCSWLGW